MSRRTMQLWLILTAIGCGLIGGGIGYYLARAPLEKDDLKKSDSAVVAPSKPSPQGSNADNLNDMNSRKVGNYEDHIVLNALTKKEREDIERNLVKEYEAARNTIGKAKFDDKVSNQRGLDQFIALQTKAAANPEMAHKYDSPIEERIGVCNLRLGRYSAAEKNFSRAINFAVSPEQERAVAVAYQAMAGLALNQKCYQDSFNYYLLAADIFEKINNRPDCNPDVKLAARLQAGNSYRCCCALKYQYLNDYKRSIELGEKAKKILELTKDKYLMGSTLATLGAAYWKDNQPVPARKHLSAGEKYLVVPNLPLDAPLIRAHALNELAAVEFKLGESKKALEYSKRALKALAHYKPVTEAEQKGIDGWRNQFLSQIKAYESAIATKSGVTGAPANGTTSSTTSASNSASK